MADTERKSHITRIYKDDDSTSDSWIDVERLDELHYKSGRENQFRRKIWKFNWNDFNPDSERVTKKKIYDPNDENNFIEIPVRKSILVKEGRGDQFQGNRYHFINDASNGTRVTHSRRVYHHEIKKQYLGQDGSPPSDSDVYLNALGDQDKDQYVEVELLDKYLTQENEGKDTQGKTKPSTWQNKKWVLSEIDPLLQEPMVETDEEDPEFVPVSNPEAGPQVDPPWRLDPLQNIVNVQWGGGDVIVVFVDGSPGPDQPSSSFTVIEEKATLISNFRTPYSADGFMPGFMSSAFKVSRNAGEFMTTAAAGVTTGDGTSLGMLLTVCVFAIGDDMDASLEQAIAGTKLIIPAINFLESTGPPDLPADMAPPGLLWLVQTGMMNGGQALTWKMRHGRHRKPPEEGGTPSELPDSMTQCYHLAGYTGPSGGVGSITWSGYQIFAYRLDKAGTDTVYGKAIQVMGEAYIQNIDPEWNQGIIDPGTLNGIPIADPPPPITSDLVTE